MEYLLLAKKEGIGYVTINRPKQLNALSTAVLGELDQAITQMDSDKDVRVVILTGAGEKSFVAGADLSELAHLDCEGARAFNSYGSKIFRRIEKMGKPVIAAINGYALGGGLELTLACDIRIASDNASFSNPETGLGSIPGFGATQRLPRLVGTGFAKEIIFSGVRINAEEAHRIGLVNRVVPLSELLPSCEDLARKIMKASPAAISYAKMVIDQGMQMDIDSGLELEWTTTGLCHETAEQKEYMQAFLDRSNKK